jgi:Protein of unknown function (DUF4058)
MPSPFPGMDPYLESWIWGDFHSNMISVLGEQLNDKLPRRYIANTELYVWREDPSRGDRLLIGGPDVHVADQRPASGASATASVVTAPVTTILPGVEARQRYLRIVDGAERRIVTVVELLSPANKGGNREAYRFKRDEYIASGVNLLEIDLLRSGVRPPLGNPAPPIRDYYALVSRAEEPSLLHIWPISIRDSLPPVPVPLDPGEPEILLDIRAAMDRVYDKGRYGEQLDYTKPPVPALREPDGAWARQLLAARLNSAPNT